MRIRLYLISFFFLCCFSCNHTVAQTRDIDLFEDDYLNSFFQVCYIDTTNSHINNPSDVKFSYICNGYGGHWQIFGVDSKGTIVLKYDQDSKPSDNGVIINEYNNSGLTCYAIVNWNYDSGHIYKSQNGNLKSKVFNRSFFPLNKINNEFVPPFHIKKSIWDFASVDREILPDEIAFSTPVINPDNILYISKEIASAKDFGPQFYNDCINPKTNLGYYVKQSWRGLYDPAHDSYDFSPLHKFFGECIEYNTRLTLRIDQTEGDYDIYYIEKPSDWEKNKKIYSVYLNKYGNWYFDKNNFLVIDSLQVTGSYPSKLFFEQITEGFPPLIKKTYNYYQKDSCYTSYFNYNANCVYDEWIRLQKCFYKFINHNKALNKAGKKVKYKYLIENLYAAVGITGEGFVGKYGIFPKDKEKYLRYYNTFHTIFRDIPVSYPLAVTYDDDFLSNDDLSVVLNYKNKLCNGRLSYSGLWYDVIGLKGFVPYSYYSNSTISKLIESPNERRFCGEGGFNDDSCSQVLTHAYLMHLSGVSQHNMPFYKNAEGRSQQQKFITLAGAKLHISDISFNNKIVTIGIENIGYCRVFSPYWETYLLCRDAKGKLLKKVKFSFDLFDVEPNSYDYHNVGVYGAPTKTLGVSIKLPPKTKTISFAIIDKYGVYENYWLHNKGRVSFSEDDEMKDGEYIILKI